MDRLKRQKLLDMQIGKKEKINVKHSNVKKGHNHDEEFFFNSLNDIYVKWNYSDIFIAISNFKRVKCKNHNRFTDYLFPSTYEELNRGKLLNYTNDLERLLCWNAIIFECYSEKMNSFILHKNAYENALINGDYELGSILLDKIETEIGFSIWGIENRFILKEYQSGLEANKEFLSDLNSKECDSWILFLADLFSFKAEKGVNERQYNQKMKRVINTIHDNNKAYFIEKIYPINKIIIDEIYNSLYFNSSASIIDIYNSFIKSCVRISSERKEDSKAILAVSRALSLINQINDVVIDKLKLHHITDHSIVFTNFDKSMFEIAVDYTEGKYDKVISKSNKLLEQNANCFELYEYYVKSHVMGNKLINETSDNNIKDELIASFYSSYIRGEKTPESFLSISKYARVFSNSNFGTSIINFYIHKYMIGESSITFRAKEFMSTYFNIRIADITKEKKNVILNMFNDAFGANSVSYLKNSIYQGELSNFKIDVNRLRWYTIKSKIKSDAKNVHIYLSEWLKELNESSSPIDTYFKERISTELYYLYIKKGLFLDAEVLYVERFINNEFSTLRMDLEKLFKSMKSLSFEMKSSIYTPIFTYLRDRNDYASIFSSVANFMDCNSIVKPSQLTEIKSKYDEKILVFFLRYICTNEILDSFYNIFDTDEDVESERIEICNFLQRIDSDNGSEYIQEISQIMQKKKIFEGVNYLENVKIDLNIIKVVEQHLKVFKDNYKRFKLIKHLDIEFKSLDTTNYVWIKNFSNTKYDIKVLALKEMLVEYRNELAFGNYGLDQALGTRVRHGSLQNQIRVAFEKNHIAFVRKSTDQNDYIGTKEFEEICRYLDEDAYFKLCKCLSDFSEKVDKYIENLTSSFIRIKTENTNCDGLIDLSLNYSEIDNLFYVTQFHENENYILEVFESFWLDKVERGLEYTKEHFSNLVKNDFIKMLNILEENLLSITGLDKINFSFIDSISRTRTEIQNSIDIIKEWFKLPAKQEYEDFDATSLIETCEMINKRAFSNYETICVEKEIKLDNKISGKYFSYLIDILIIQFTNAYFHSGYVDDIKNLKIKLSIIENIDNIEIKMVNNVENSVNRDNIKKTVEDLHRELRVCVSTKEYANFEGKSGYIKICKILDYYLNDVKYIDFGLINENKDFISLIQIGKSIISKVGVVS